MKPRLSPRQLAAGLGSAAAYLALAYCTPRPAFGQLLALYLLAFGGYALLVQQPPRLRYGLALALLFRLLWLPALPALSDDYHRFRWDGALVAAGQNPYRARPQELMVPAAREQRLPGLSAAATAELYAALNSKPYYSVYPPLCQAAFGAASALFPTSARGFVLVLRLLILGAEAATAGLLLAMLRRFGQPPRRALLYLLNPLVIVELTGNVHFEALMICGLLAAMWALAQGRRAWSAAALAGAVATKLLPLLLLPLLLRRLGWARWLSYSALTTLVLLGLFAPFFSRELVSNLGQSLELYFHKFEFNAGLYYLLRAVGYWQTGYNQIARLGTLLAGGTLLTVAGVALREKQPTWASLPRTLLLVFTAYFALATTVHPWYLTTLVALSVFSRYRYALVWSALVPLSYAAYQTSAYTENLWLVGLEYGLVAGVLLWELRVAGRTGHDAQPRF
ncbi:hypothetical protein E5K00_05650 [Hymenobacter aquaticus]|uniref:DUF2029 domain-containing protein n=1 Tax=Hymenobacter aquaticus TaxID=1867101 RepID=A0A4Z0Q5E2_9BACT|nr:hypothetical protein [Hymenobacter aquaticus]TGE24696.1 hypothetical protein E5K00_05650 [Hymenobacter aquaticus]